MTRALSRRTAAQCAGAVLLAACAAWPGPAETNPEGVERAIARLAEASGGTVGIAAVHLETGRRVALNGGERFPMASTYKFPIALRVLRMVDRGELRLDQTVTLGERDFRPGWSPLADFANGSPVTVTVGRLLELMVIDSDNSASDALMRLAGGPVTVTARLRELGASAIDVNRYEAQFFIDGVGIRDAPPEGEWTIARLEALAAKVSPEERRAANDRYAADPRDTTTPDAMADLLVRAFRGEALSPASTGLLLRLMAGSTTGAARLKGRLPAGTVVAHKSGTQGGTTNDVGVVTLPDGAGHVAIAVYVKGSAKEVEEREHAIAEISRTVYDYFVLAGGAR